MTTKKTELKGLTGGHVLASRKDSSQYFSKLAKDGWKKRRAAIEAWREKNKKK